MNVNVADLEKVCGENVAAVAAVAAGAVALVAVGAVLVLSVAAAVVGAVLLLSGAAVLVAAVTVASIWRRCVETMYCCWMVAVGRRRRCGCCWLLEHVVATWRVCVAGG